MFEPRSDAPASNLAQFRAWARGKGLSSPALWYGTAEALKRDYPDMAALYDSQAANIPATSDEKSTVNSFFAGMGGGK